MNLITAKPARLRLIPTPGARMLAVTLDAGVESHAFDEINAELREVLATAPGQRWVLDLTEVRCAGSSLLGMLLNARQQVRAGGGRLVVCGMSSKLRSMMSVCSLEALFEIRRSREDALRILARG